MDFLDELCSIKNVIPKWKFQSKKSGRAILTDAHFPVLCKDTGEICATYEAYLKSVHWQHFRKRYYNSKLFHSKTHFGGINGKCVCCQEPNKILDLHHITYKRLGQEKLWDVIPACQDCHKDVHDFIKTINQTKKSDWILLRYTSWRRIKQKNDSVFKPTERNQTRFAESPHRGSGLLAR